MDPFSAGDHLLHTAVQRDDAPGQIVRAIELAYKRNECDVGDPLAVAWVSVGRFHGVLMMSVWRGRFLPVAFR